MIGFLSEIHAAGVDLYVHVQGLDTSTPSGKAMFELLDVFAEFERRLIRERVMAGLARARKQGAKSGRLSGRPKIDGAVEAAICGVVVADLAKVAAVSRIAIRRRQTVIGDAVPGT